MPVGPRRADGCAVPGIWPLNNASMITLVRQQPGTRVLGAAGQPEQPPPGASAV
jgi:hypothetical protein